MKFLLVPILFFVFQTVFANPYAENFQFGYDYNDVKLDPNTQFLKTNETPKILYLDNSEDIYDYLSEGYIPIGSANFVSNAASEQQVIQQAKKVKAKLVLVQKQLLDQSLELKNVSERSTNQWFYNIESVFLVKDESYKQGSLGVSVGELSQELTRKYQRNTGVVVFLVYKNSPAYRANLLRNDVITKINSRDVWEDNFLTVLNDEKRKSNNVILSILRDGVDKKIPVTLGW